MPSKPPTLRSRLVAAVALGLAASCSSPAPKQQDIDLSFPEPPLPPRLVFLRSIGTGEDIEPGRSKLDSFLFGETETKRKVIPKPFGCTVHKGIVYLTDTAIAGIVTIDFANNKLDQVRLRGRARLQKPMNLRFSKDGLCYVADSERGQIVVLNEKFEWVKEFGPYGDKCGFTDVRIAGDRLYAVDARGRCLRVLDRNTGKELFNVGQKLSRDERMRGPTSVALDEHENAYVVDTIYNRVYVWDKDGKFIRHIGAAGDLPGSFARPKGIAYFDHTVWVLDSAFENCQILDLDGRALMFFGGSGLAPGTFYMPATISIGKDGLELFKDRIKPDFVPEALVVVTNQFGPNKVTFFAYGKSKKFEYPDSKLPLVPTPAEKEKPPEKPAKPRK